MAIENNLSPFDPPRHLAAATPRLLLPVYKPDVWIFLILIPIISAINYYLTYTNIRFNAFLVMTFCLDTAQGYAAWWVVRIIIRYLDKVLPYEHSLSRNQMEMMTRSTL